jgi:uncharacterized protein
MAGPVPEETVSTPAAQMAWQTMTFLHWSYEPEAVQRLLPSGLEVHTYDGKAWVGLTPFVMKGFRPNGLPAVPGLSNFPETNLRTYAVGPDGRDGLFFLSLEVDSLPTFLGARATYWVPYEWADMSVDEGEPIRYRSRRRRDGSACHDIAVSPGAPVEPDELSEFDHWLTGRWRAWTRIAGQLASVPVHHEPWPFWHCEIVRVEQTLTDKANLPRPTGDPVVHFSSGVQSVKLGPPRPCRN